MRESYIVTQRLDERSTLSDEDGVDLQDELVDQPGAEQVSREHPPPQR